MISQVNSTAIANTYSKNNGEVKQAEQKTDQKTGVNVSKQGDMSKVEQIKEALASGEYKINLQALSEKIAEELL